MIGKTLLPKLIYATESKHNGRIDVYQIGSLLKLSVGGIVQSVSHNSKYAKRSVWGATANLIKRSCPRLQNVLILGLGGGTTAHLLTKDFPNVKITTIEIDKEMVDVAKRYFELDKLSNHKVIVGDALRIIADPAKFDVETKSFDLIIVDIYCGNKYPDLGNSGTFFAGVRNLLRGKGLIVFNRIYLKNHQNEVDIFCDLVSQQFKDVKTKTVAGRTNSDNILIYGRS